MGHEANDAKDDKPSEDAGAAIPEGDQYGVLVDVVVELVVAGEGDHDAPGDAQGEEDLGTGVCPDPDVGQPVPLRGEVEGDPVQVAGQGGDPHQQDDEDDVREQCSDVHSLNHSMKLTVNDYKDLTLPIDLIPFQRAQ